MKWNKKGLTLTGPTRSKSPFRTQQLEHKTRLYIVTFSCLEAKKNTVEAATLSTNNKSE